VIWGTNVNVQETQSKFSKFITEFIGEDNDGADEPKYIRLMRELKDTERGFINIDCTDLYDHDAVLYQQLVRYPQEVVPIFDLVVQAEYQEKIDDQSDMSIQVRTFNLRDSGDGGGGGSGGGINMRELNPENIDQLISISGMIIRTSSIIPDMKEAFFECLMCKNSVEVAIENGFIAEPQTCTSCQAKKSFQLIHNRCKFADKQLVKLQETPESIPDGQTPQTVVSYVYDEMVDNVSPGERVVVTGIYRATPLRVNSNMRTVKAVYKTHIDVLHFGKITGTRMRKAGDDEEGAEDPEAKAAMEAQIVELSQQPDVYERLVRALAPNIYEFDDVKKGVLLQLFGGTDKTFTNSGRGRFRGEINVLLCGDPGTAKSQLLQYAVKLAARGIYTSGKGSSAVGLTAYVTKDPETKQNVLESGALVLCDGGICCIDEFDKMSDNTRSVLHEAMEQQTVSIAKAGIIASLNARTSILAAANPLESRWNRSMSVIENLQLPPTLLSRFDLIYLILDTPNKESDRRLASHLVELYYREEDRTPKAPVMNREILSRYISYAKEKCHPVLEEEASRDLVKAYVEMRKAGNQKGTITATPRQLESLIRLAEAHARVRLSEKVEEVDVAEATRLVKAAMRQAATDPRTGQIDLDLLTTGHSTAQRTLAGQLQQAILEALGEAPNKSLKLQDLTTKLAAQSAIAVTGQSVRDVLPTLQQDNAVYIQGGMRGANPTISLSDNN
jgi:DNA replication licensing factor MCM4